MKQIPHYTLIGIGLALLISTKSIAAPSNDWPLDYPVVLESVSIDSTYDTLFTAQQKGWLGADAAHSIVLSEERVLWLFGDTYIGEVRDGHRYPEGYHINNCIAIEDRSKGVPGEIKYYWGEKNGYPTAFFPPQADMPGHFFWPTSGLVVKGRLLLFSFAMQANDTTWWLAGTVVAAINNYKDDPALWQAEYYDLELGNNQFGIHSALFLEGEYIYFMGFSEFSEGQSAILGRAEQKGFCENPSGNLIEYWSKGWFKNQWCSIPNKLVPLFSPGVTETDIQYISDWKLFVATTYDPMKPEICLTTANSLTGPWTEPVHIFTNPDHVTMTYAARPHPQISRESGEIIISYITSPTSLDITKESMDTYRPRFLKIKLALR